MQQRKAQVDYLLENKLQSKIKNVEEQNQNNKNNINQLKNKFIQLDKRIKENKYKQFIAGGGCFWCIEAMLQRVQGVIKTQVGYSGGHIQNPEYQQVKSGESGHAEVLKIIYDETQISLFDLIYIFMNIHDPTTLNRQLYDKGTQYRSIILYQNQEELEIAQDVFEQITYEKLYQDPIVTELKQFKQFYIADDKHQNFYEENPEYPYCRKIINPKMNKFMKKFSQITK